MRGPMIDEEVAEKVMGWKKPVMGKMWVRDHESPIEDSYTGYMQPDATMGVVFSPSTRIDDAWLVVEKMQKDHVRPKWWFHIHAPSILDKDWTVYIKSPTKNIAFAYADTAPLAICRAALAALEGK